jgi:hypothetical protein
MLLSYLELLAMMAVGIYGLVYMLTSIKKDLKK